MNDNGTTFSATLHLWNALWYSLVILVAFSVTQVAVLLFVISCSCMAY